MILIPTMGTGQVIRIVLIILIATNILISERGFFVSPSSVLWYNYFISKNYFMMILVLQRMALEFLVDLFYFPIWWYTAGAKKALLFCVDLVREGSMNLAPGLWFKNIMVPMFGQYDWQGRIMSFFMRLVNVIIRSILLAIWVAVVFVIFMFWFILPGFVLFMFLNSIFKF